MLGSISTYTDQSVHSDQIHLYLWLLAQPHLLHLFSTLSEPFKSYCSSIRPIFKLVSDTLRRLTPIFSRTPDPAIDQLNSTNDSMPLSGQDDGAAAAPPPPPYTDIEDLSTLILSVLIRSEGLPTM